MLNALTVDVEDWYMTSDYDIPPEQWHLYEDRVVDSTMELLNLFARYQARGTFFILGCVAEKHPELVKEIAARGHEIASHGYWHRMLTRLTPEEFRADLRAAKEVLESVSGRPVTLYRAPSWSVSADRLSYLRIMHEEGVAIDSSLQPFRTPLSGISGMPLAPFKPVVEGSPIGILEFPPTVLKLFGVTVPFSGGFYLRATPSWMHRFALRTVNRTRPGMIYIHPWEIDPGQPNVKAGLLARLTHRYGLRVTRRKLERLLKSFSFAPLGEVAASAAVTFPEIAIGGSAETSKIDSRGRRA